MSQRRQQERREWLRPGDASYSLPNCSRADREALELSTRPSGALHPGYHVDHVANTDHDGRAAPSQIKAKAANTAPPQLPDAGVSWTPAIQPQAKSIKRLLPLMEPLMYPSMVSGPSQFLLGTQETGL